MSQWSKKLRSAKVGPARRSQNIHGGSFCVIKSSSDFFSNLQVGMMILGIIISHLWFKIWCFFNNTSSITCILYVNLLIARFWQIVQFWILKFKINLLQSALLNALFVFFQIFFQLEKCKKIAVESIFRDIRIYFRVLRKAKLLKVIRSRRLCNKIVF